MVILLVDDQASVLSSLKTGVDWDSLSIQTRKLSPLILLTSF